MSYYGTRSSNDEYRKQSLADLILSVKSIPDFHYFVKHAEGFDNGRREIVPLGASGKTEGLRAHPYGGPLWGEGSNT